MAIGRCSYSSEWDAVSVYNHGAFDTLLSPIHRVFARHLATARSLRDAAVDAHIEKLQADDVIVGIEHYLLQFLHRPGVDPFIAPTTQSGCRTRLIGDPLIGAAKNEYLHEFVEDQPVRYPVAMAAERMIYLSR